MQLDAQNIPTSDINLFSEASLREPFQDYHVLRELGPVVKLKTPDVYAISRYADVRDALQAATTLVSGQGVGFGEAWNSQAGMSVIQSDGDLHHRLRSAILPPLLPDQISKLRGQLKELISARIAALRNAGPFDAMIEVARFLPVEAIAHFVGLSSEGRERLLVWAAAMFNTIGPDPDPNDLAVLMEIRDYLVGLKASDVKANSWAGQLFDHMSAGKLAEHEVMSAIYAYIIPSLDTTIFAKGHLLYNLARHPDQWRKLRDRPELISSAVYEGVRHSSVVRWFSRVAVQDYKVGDYTIPAGARVMLLYGAANRDSRQYADAERFDVTRNPRDQLGWGRGRHLCAGIHLARLEMEVMLEALVETGEGLHAGEPVTGANQGLFGFVELPFEIGGKAGNVGAPRNA